MKGKKKKKKKKKKYEKRSLKKKINYMLNMLDSTIKVRLWLFKDF